MQRPMPRYMYEYEFVSMQILLSQVGDLPPQFLRRNFRPASHTQRTRIDKINKYENLRQKFGIIPFYFGPPLHTTVMWVVAFNFCCWIYWKIDCGIKCARPNCLLSPGILWLSANHPGLQLPNGCVTPSKFTANSEGLEIYAKRSVRYLK